MGNVVIKAENISKLYRLGTIGTGSFAKDLNRWWSKIRGQEDPYSKIGELNDRTQKGNSEYVWALKDINFEVNQGEVVGIIGKNGAGKSTLLKILSRTTAPSIGTLKAKGRIASLLEVGTGFHPELSGRDNIFLNGAILGMTKNEIKSKFDQIVSFAGVERYIDTPVKRYSSGMYVRLAFAVAAHLESEILIVDEVLAVGDAEFQKKCLGKMGDVSSKDGRTVLFVSHNLHAVKELCNSCLYMKHGQLISKDKTDTILGLYTSDFTKIGSDMVTIKPGVFNLMVHPNKKNPDIGILETRIEVDGLTSDTVYTGSTVRFIFSYQNHESFIEPVLGIVLKDQYGEPFIGINNRHTGQKICTSNLTSGTIIIEIPEFKAYYDGICSMDIYFGDSENNFDTILNAIQFEIITTDVYKSGRKLDTSYNKFFDTKVNFK
jgi:lipopolysaccharide transport system ATP-binding protein